MIDEDSTHPEILERIKKNQPGGISLTVHKCYSAQKASSNEKAGR
jgi:hypothetical protein